MKVKLNLLEWKIKIKDSGARVIAGKYEIKSGGTVLAKQHFNDGYGDVLPITFSTQLIVKMEELEKEIAKEIQEMVE